jgi:hypothetical protein
VCCLLGIFVLSRGQLIDQINYLPTSIIHKATIYQTLQQMVVSKTESLAAHAARLYILHEYSCDLQWNSTAKQVIIVA